MVRQTLFRHCFSAAVLFVCAVASLTAQQLAPTGGTVDRRHTVLPKLGSEGEALNKVSLAN